MKQKLGNKACVVQSAFGLYRFNTFFSLKKNVD